jgi:hypothetical protein
MNSRGDKGAQKHRFYEFRGQIHLRRPNFPAHRRDATFKKAPRSRPAPGENFTLPLLPNED